MNLSIRPFERTDSDYETVVGVGNACEPEYPGTVEEVRGRDARRPEKIRWARYLAELDGRPMAVSGCGNSLWHHDPLRFDIEISVLPEERRRGIGGRLFDHLLRELEPLEPAVLKAWTRDDRPDDGRFVLKRGFEEVGRDWESRLKLSNFNPRAWDSGEVRLRTEGIEFDHLRSLMERFPDWDRRLHDLQMEVHHDIPSISPATDVPFDTWRSDFVTSLSRRPEATFIALHEDRFVAVSELCKPQVGEHLDTSITGVRRAYRRKGLALALKLRALTWAKEQGYPEIRTWNSQRNEGMLSINVRLGFEKQPAWIEYALSLTGK